jgi:amino acid adenylation domain-containing protein
MPAALRLSGELDRAALVATLDRIIARHENLRTTFVQVDGQPVQRIAAPDCGFALTLHSLGQEQQHEQVRALAAAEAASPFDLATGPLIRGRLIQLSDREHILLVTQHHIISDGWSIDVLIREVGALYTAFSQGLPDPLPPLALQYADYAAWQRQWLQGEVLERQLDFWRSHLNGAPELLTLPTDRARPARQSYRGASVAVTLSPELSTALGSLAQRHGCTLFMTLFAGWAVLMARLSGQDDVVIGTPVANRQRLEIESLIGFFVNSLAVRVRLDDDPGVGALLERVRTTMLDAYTHQDVPFEQVVEAVQPVRSLSHSPLFQTMFTLNSASANGALNLPGLGVAPVTVERDATHFDLSLSLTDTGAGIVGTIDYASDLFDADTVARMAGYFEHLLDSMAGSDARQISRIALLSGEQRDQMVTRFNATQTAYPTGLLIHQLFEAQAAARPDAVALVFEDQHMSYEELNRRANQIAHGLIGMGVRPDDRVAVFAERSMHMVIGLLGILKAGGAYVPLDPGYPEERLVYMLDDCAPIALLTQARLHDRLPVLPVPVIDLDDAELDGEDAGDNPIPAGLGLTPGHLAYVIYTSGSTGMPKGVMNQHDGVVNRLHWALEKFGLDGQDRVLQKTPFGFDVSVWEFFLTLGAGATLVIAPPGAHQQPEAIAGLVERHGVTMLHFVPSMLQAFVAHDQAASLAKVQHIICSGEALPYALRAQVHAELPEVRLHNLYGPTEAAVDVSCWTCEPDEHVGITPIGKPIANTRLYLLDAHQQPVPLGVVGEIYISGVQVARGYLNRPELTAERFVADPFSTTPDARMYRTGDLGRWLDDGNIEYLGRNDFQVKLRGFRIELGEIEARLLECEGVREAVVVMRGDAPGHQHLVAYFVAHEGTTVFVHELRSALQRTVPLYGSFLLCSTGWDSAFGERKAGSIPAAGP